MRKSSTTAENQDRLALQPETSSGRRSSGARSQTRRNRPSLSCLNQMNGGRNLVLSMHNSEGIHFVMPAWDNAPTKHLHETLMKLLMLRRVESRPRSRREKPFGQKHRNGQPRAWTQLASVVFGRSTVPREVETPCIEASRDLSSGASEPETHDCVPTCLYTLVAKSA